MENSTEGVQPQNTVQEVVPALTQAEIDDLKHKAEVSSQNFERAKKAEAKLKELEEYKLEVKPSDEVFSDEGKVLDRKYQSLEQKFAQMEEERNLERLFNQYPLLKEKADEFKEYRSAEHPRAKIESVAKLYLAENGLLESKTRVGLEQSTGGDRVPVASGMTSDEVKNLRTNNPRKYREMLKNDQIKFS